MWIYESRTPLWTLTRRDEFRCSRFNSLCFWSTSLHSKKTQITPLSHSENSSPNHRQSPGRKRNVEIVVFARAQTAIINSANPQTFIHSRDYQASLPFLPVLRSLFSLNAGDVASRPGLYFFRIYLADFPLSSSWTHGISRHSLDAFFCLFSQITLLCCEFIPLLFSFHKNLIHKHDNKNINSD